jgi:predicted AlkP superfamily phosphohydrolase/phosphomutase
MPRIPPRRTLSKPSAIARKARAIVAAAIVAATISGCGGGQASRPRVLVIGLDGACWDVLEPWLREGKLPNIARLRDAGVWGDLESVTPPLSAPAWTTAVTGVNPGRHGVLNFILVDPRNYTPRMATSRDRRAPAVWEYMTHAGLAAGIVNVPLTSPADSLDGFMIGGFPHADSVGTFFPTELRSELEREASPLLFDNYGEQLPPGREVAELDQLLATLDSKLAVTRHLMKTRDWDLLWVVFLASDKVHHFYWQYADSLHPAYDPAAPQRLKDAMFEVWAALDRAVGELVADAGPECTIVILSDHGSGPVRREFRLLNWLVREGYAKPDLRDSRIIGFQPYGGDLYVHDGRFPLGPVPDSLRDALAQELRSKLAAVRDPEHEGPVFSTIHTKEEIYSGPATANAPDLLFEGAPGWLVSRGKGNPEAPLFGPPAYTFSGYHLPEGILIAAGPRIAKAGRVAGSRLIDIAPTLLYLLDCEVPKAMEGSVLRPLVDGAWLDEHPPRVGEIQIDRPTEATEAIRALPYIR